MRTVQHIDFFNGSTLGWCIPPKVDFRKNHHKCGCRRVPPSCQMVMKSEKNERFRNIGFQKIKKVGIGSVEIVLEQFQISKISGKSRKSNDLTVLDCVSMYLCSNPQIRLRFLWIFYPTPKVDSFFSV